MDIKWCSFCDTEKPLSEFRKNVARSDGHSQYCRVCDRIYHLEYQREYRRDPEHHAKELARKRKFNKENRKALNQKRRERYWNNPEKSRAQGRKLYYKHLEYAKIQAKKYRKTTGGREAIQRANKKMYYKRKANLLSCEINDLSNEEIKLLLEKSPRCCPICRKPFTKKKRKKTIDHIVPMSRHGNNTLLNTQVICQNCNSRKKTEEYTKFNNGQLLMFV